MKIRRQPRKLMRLAAAAALLQCSRGTIRNLIYVENRLDYVQPKPGTTSPIKVYEAQVVEIAKQWGIL